MAPSRVNEKQQNLSSNTHIIVGECSSIEETRPSQSIIEYGTTWTAWIQVLSAMLINTACSIMWLSACSSPASTSEWLQISYTSLNWLSNVSAIITSILSLVTGWSYQRFGIKENVTLVLYSASKTKLIIRMQCSAFLRV